MFTGRPQLRLSQFLASGALQTGVFPSPPMMFDVCDRARYAGVIEPLAESAAVRIGPDCLPALPSLRPDGTPDCLVGDVPLDAPQSTPEHALPVCAAGCCAAFSSQPTPTPVNSAIAAACAAEPADCFCAGPRLAGDCYSGAMLSVWRKDNADPPPGTIVNGLCAVDCSSRPPS
jgi:hypothetical protein